MEETSMIVSPCVPSIDTSPSLLSISLFCPFTFATCIVMLPWVHSHKVLREGVSCNE